MDSIRTVGDLKKVLGKFDDDLPITIADIDDEYLYIASAGYPELVNPVKGIKADTSQVMIFTEKYREYVLDEMYWEIEAAREMGRLNNEE